MKTYIECAVGPHKIRGFEDCVSKDVVVFFHGFTGNKTESSRLFFHLSNEFVKEGISTLRFDWLGHGESDLEFVDARVDLLQDQAEIVLQYAKRHYQNVYLLGFSMGGAFAMHHVTNDIKKLVLLAPAYHMGKMKETMFNNIKEDTIDLNGFVFHREFASGFQALQCWDHVHQYDGPILIIQGGQDGAVSPESSKVLHESLPNSEYLYFEDADHCFHHREYHHQISKALVTFLSK
jgi:pimeloyl-ACP methyl ester carboxylesterase